MIALPAFLRRLFPPRTADRIGEEVPRPFPGWLMRWDPFLIGWEQNGIFDAFECRRRYHRRAIVGTWQENLDRGQGCLIFLAALLCCGWAHLPGILIGIWLFRWIFSKIAALSPGERKPEFPRRITDLIVREGIMAQECTDLWMAGQSGDTFCRAMYLEMRRGAHQRIRVGQVFAGLMLFGIPAMVLIGLGRPLELIGPMALLWMALSARFVWLLGPVAAISGMRQAADELRARRTALLRGVSGTPFYRLDKESRRSGWRLLKGLGLGLLITAALFASGAIWVGMVELLGKSENPAVSYLGRSGGLLVGCLWLGACLAAMEMEVRRWPRRVTECADSLRLAGWGFELVIAIYNGAGDEEIDNWVGAIEGRTIETGIR